MARKSVLVSDRAAVHVVSHQLHEVLQAEPECFDPDPTTSVSRCIVYTFTMA